MYTQIQTPIVVQGRGGGVWGGGGGLMEPSSSGFDKLQYFETILPSVESLWSSQTDEVYFMGGGATEGLWRHQKWSLKSSLKNYNWGGLINTSQIVSFWSPRHYFLHIWIFVDFVFVRKRKLCTIWIILFLVCKGYTVLNVTKTVVWKRHFKNLLMNGSIAPWDRRWSVKQYQGFSLISPACIFTAANHSSKKFEAIDKGGSIWLLPYPFRYIPFFLGPT